MGEEEQKTGAETSEISAESLVRLAEIEKNIADITSLRKKQFFINLGGMFAMAVIIAAFLGNLFSFAQNYDTDTLLNELTQQAEEIAASPQSQDMMRELQAEFLPLYRDELLKQITARGPELRKRSLEMAGNLETYLRKDVHKRLETELTSALDGLEKDLIKRYPGLDLTAAQIEEVFNHGQARFLEETSRHMQTRLDSAMQELAVLQAKFNQFKDTPEYKELKKEHVDEIQCRLLESMLELWIYHLNPSKGNRLAYVGGKK